MIGPGCGLDDTVGIGLGDEVGTAEGVGAVIEVAAAVGVDDGVVVGPTDAVGAADGDGASIGVETLLGVGVGRSVGCGVATSYGGPEMSESGPQPTIMTATRMAK